MATPRPIGSASPPIRSWTDGYTALRRRAGEMRGWIELDTDAPDRRWPRTTGLDVILIASFIDKAFQTTDQATFAGTALRWQSCKDDLEREALPALSDTYHGNRDFWPCLAMMCSHLSWVGCHVPPQAAWRALLDLVGAHSGGARNAPVWFDLDELYRAQRSYLGNLHGFDRMAPEADMRGGVIPVPRSTNGEVLQLAAFWSQTMQESKAKNTNGYASVLKQWDAVMRDVEAYARGASPDAVYSYNHRLWRGIQSIAIHTAASLNHSDGARNALAAPDRPPVWFANAGELDDLYRAQRSYLGNLHGFDRMAPEADMLGGVMPVPRSTNGEVLQLAAFWAKVIEEPKAKNTNGYATVLKHWNAAMRDVETHARGADPDAVYPHNHRFWRGVQAVAIHTAASLKYGLSDAERWMASVGERLLPLQQASAKAKQVATAIAEGLGDVAAGAAHGAGRILHESARGLLGGLATPLLIGGGVIATVLLLRNRHEPARSEARS